MKLIRPLIFCCLICLTGLLSAQDLHWSLFTYSPLTLNPAFTGAYEGSYRIGGIIRDQAPTLSYANSSSSDNNIYLSYNIFVDAPIITGLRKQDWVGVGINFYSDEAGALNLGQDYFQASLAYHIGLNKKQTSTFTIGLHGGSGARGIDTQTAAFGKDLENPTFMPGSSVSSYTTGIEEKSSHFELGLGLLFRSQVNKTTGFNMGLNFKHIIPSKKYGLVKNTQDVTKLPLTIGFHAQLDSKMNDKWSITPALAFQNARSANEIQIQSMLGYLFNEDKNVVLNFGLGYRVSDAGQVLLGFDYGAFRAAASFDLSLSGISAINKNMGGFELGLSYIGRIYKDPAVKPVIFCPRF